MTAARAATVTIELTAVADGNGHVEGTVRTPDGDPIEFSGWLALLEVLERSTVQLRDEQ